jgi:hypothetical protein
LSRRLLAEPPPHSSYRLERPPALSCGRLLVSSLSRRWCCLKRCPSLLRQPGFSNYSSSLSIPLGHKASQLTLEEKNEQAGSCHRLLLNYARRMEPICWKTGTSSRQNERLAGGAFGSEASSKYFSALFYH